MCKIRFATKINLREYKRCMKRIKTLLFALICLSISALAQKNVVGTVLDTESRFPLIGVSIIEEGTQNGCSTDVDGNFSIKLSDGNKHLVISCVFRSIPVHQFR